MEVNYKNKALIYAESYGIVTYHVDKNLLIYYQNYRNPEYIGGKWQDNPCTYKRVVNLDTYECNSELLSRLNKEGWDNV